MPSLRQKVTTYFRQLSFIAEPRDGQRDSHKDEDDGNFITKYLEGRMERAFLPSPEICSGKDPTDLPTLKIASYVAGAQTITAACTGPDEGLTGIKRSKLHLSASFADDIDFIDTMQDSDFDVRKSINTNSSSSNNRNYSKFNRSTGSRKSVGSSGVAAGATNAVTTTNSNDANANKTNVIGAGNSMRARKNSKTNIANVNKLSKDKDKQQEDNCNNKSTTIVVSMVSTKTALISAATSSDATNDQNNRNLLNAGTESKTETSKQEQQTAKQQMAQKLHEVVSESSKLMSSASNASNLIASVPDWNMETDFAYGISVSLYENNMLTKEPMGNPIADCYGMVVHKDVAAMALADGVNWGDGARLAARSAVNGCLDYLDRAIFSLATDGLVNSTEEVFVSLLRSIWEGHACILEVGGALSTLTCALVLPLQQLSEHAHNNSNDQQQQQKYVVCACNVGDSLGFVYSKKYGVREFTQASHDISSMRDMRDALGAIGPADGNKPDLSNLTFSMTVIEKGDIVFLTSDGISDNFDPVVGKFAEAWTPDVQLQHSQSPPRNNALAPKRQNKSASSIYARLHGGHTQQQQQIAKKSNVNAAAAAMPSRPKYMRSHTFIEPRRPTSAEFAHRQASVAQASRIPKSITGLPLVTAAQRYALTLYRLEDLLSYGINGTFAPCGSARRLCHLLIDFVRMITSARRKTLEQRELFYKLVNGADGVKREVELNRMQHRMQRKRIIDSSAFAALPGKLDHATVLAYTAGSISSEAAAAASCHRNTPAVALLSSPLQSKEFRETNF